MPKYLFNYEATVEVIAASEDDARELFWLATEQQVMRPDEDVDIIDSDVMLVEVTDYSVRKAPVVSPWVQRNLDRQQHAHELKG